MIGAERGLLLLEGPLVVLQGLRILASLRRVFAQTAQQFDLILGVAVVRNLQSQCIFAVAQCLRDLVLGLGGLEILIGAHQLDRLRAADTRGQHQSHGQAGAQPLAKRSGPRSGADIGKSALRHF